MTPPDPVSAAARAAARHLAAAYGQGLAADVETALRARDTPQQYFDPVSVGSLIVAIATLAWTIYTDKKKETSQPPPPSLIIEQVHAELREYDGPGTNETASILSIVVTEISHAIHTNP